MFCCPQPGLQREDLVKALSQHIDDGTRFLDRSDESLVNKTLGDAFVDDPMKTWIAGLDGSDPKNRDRMLFFLGWMQGGVVRNSFGKKTQNVLLGTTKTTTAESSDLTGAMILCPSGGKEASILDWVLWTIHYGGYPLEKDGYGPYSDQRLRSLKILQTKRNEITKDYPDHIYLMMVGVSSNCQGKGVGGKMFRAVFQAADSLGVPVYLETESENNEAMYKHYGFETKANALISVDGDTSPDAEFKAYCMLRMPR